MVKHSMRQHIVPEVLTNIFIVNHFKISVAHVLKIKIASYIFGNLLNRNLKYNSEIAVEIVFMHSNFKRYVLNLKKCRVQCMKLDRGSAYEIE